MSRIRNMNESLGILIRPASNTDCKRVQELVFSVLHEYGLELELAGTDRDLEDLEANYVKRGGIFELLENSHGRLVGTVGLYPIDGETIELRKMYFAKDLRGKGYGRKMLARMIETAKNLGYKRIYLETASVLKAAIHLYEKFGFQPVEEKHTPRCDRAYYLNLQ